MNQPMSQEQLKIFETLPPLPSQGLILVGMLMAVCREGRISAVIDSSSRTMKPGGILVLRPGHVIQAIQPSEDFKGFFISVPEKEANEMLPTMKFLHVAVRYENNPLIQVSTQEISNLLVLLGLLKEKLERVERGLPYARESLESLCNLMFYDTLSLYTSHITSAPRGARRQELLDRFIELVEVNFKSERSVDFYARKLFLTPKHLSSMVKLTSGHTAGELITIRVMAQARLMLRNSGLNIQEIADMLNFKTQSFFGKYFKTHSGVSPREFRRGIFNL